MRQALRSPEAVQEVKDKGLLAWSEENVGSVITPNDGGVSDDPLFTADQVDMMAGTATPYPYQPEPSGYGDALAQREALRAADPDAPFQSRWRDNREGPLGLGIPIDAQSRSAPTPFRGEFDFDPLASPEATLADRQAAEDFLYSLPPEQRARFGPPGGDGSVFSEEQITAVINARRARSDPQRAFPTTLTETEVEAITPAYDPDNPAAIAGLGVPTLSMDPRLSRNMNLDRDLDLNQIRLQAMMADMPAAQAPPRSRRKRQRPN